MLLKVLDAKNNSKAPIKVKTETKKKEKNKIEVHIAHNTDYLEQIRPPQSPRAVPKTTSGMIGWRSSDKLCNLDKYGPYTKGKLTITKSFHWPAEACE